MNSGLSYRGREVGVHIACKKGDCHDDLHSGVGKVYISLWNTLHGLYYHPPTNNDKQTTREEDKD